MFARFFKQELMWKWDTNTTPLATNKLHERNHSCSCSTATRHEFELWPNVNTILYILTDAKSCHEQPRAARNYKELQRTAQKSHELPRSTGDADSKQEFQELPVATRSCQQQQRSAKWCQKLSIILHTARMYQVLTVTLTAHSYYRAAKNVLKRPGKNQLGSMIGDLAEYDQIRTTYIFTNKGQHTVD